MPEETVSAVLAEMMAAAKSNELFDGEEVGEPLIRGTIVAGWADRIKVATARNAKTFWNMLEGAAAAMDGMREERDRAVKYANAAPHPGSASWKEMQAAFAAAKERKPEENYGNVAELRKTLEDAHHLIEAFLATVGDRAMKHEFLEMRHRIQDANAAPPRNCDVGSPDEQAERFGALCRRFSNCSPCPVHAVWGEFKEGRTKSCQMIWGQLPYDPAKGGAKCVDGLRGDPDCRGCEEHCEAVRRRNCINWSGDHCAKTKGIFCPVSCDKFRAYKPAEGERHA